MQTIAWWTVVAATAAPVLLVGGFLGATALQPAPYDPVRDTISQLAARGATDPWVMTAALVGLGSCYLIAALGLQSAGLVSRVLLTTGGAATVLIAIFRQPRHGYSVGHELAVVWAALTCCTWPAFVSHREPQAPLLRRTPSLAAAGVSVGLAVWYALASRGALLGLAERCAAAAPPLWLFAVAISSRAPEILQGKDLARHVVTYPEPDAAPVHETLERL